MKRTIGLGLCIISTFMITKASIQPRRSTSETCPYCVHKLGVATQARIEATQCTCKEGCACFKLNCPCIKQRCCGRLGKIKPPAPRPGGIVIPAPKPVPPAKM